MLVLADILAILLFAMLLTALLQAIAQHIFPGWNEVRSDLPTTRSRTPLLGRRKKNEAKRQPKSNHVKRILGLVKRALVDEEQGPEPPTRQSRSASLDQAFAGFDETHAAAYDDIDWTDEYIRADHTENYLLNSLPALKRWPSWALPSMPESFADKYELLRTMPDISCAPVHFVKDRATGKSLVIKQLKCRLVNGEFRQPKEAEIVSQHLAPHPNIMAVKAVHIVEDGVHFPYANVVMEHCQGGDLFDFMNTFRQRGTQVPASFILHFASSMIDALAFIHHGHTAYDEKLQQPIIASPEQPAILHRDVKPDNIFLQWHDSNSKNGMPDIILADFGHAALETENTGVRGTTDYFAPEVLAAELFARRSSDNEYLSDRTRVCSKASDMYSFVLTLFELMTLHLYQPGEDLEKAFNESLVSHHVEILVILQQCLVENPAERQLADAFHFISHTLKQRLQSWENDGERVSDHVWPASFQSRDGPAPASSVYSAHSGRSSGSKDAVCRGCFQ